jgi:AcrR family transcriptional regulator
MNPLSKEDVRAYRSELREQQAAATRRRILDATVRVIAGGLADVTVPAVARTAGVSVPTVYRHFATKRALLAALQPHLQQQAGIDRIVAPTSLGGLRGTLERLIGGLDNLDDVTRAALASPASEAVRRVHAPNRLKLARSLLDGLVDGLSEVDRERIARLFVILTTSAALRMWRDDFGASVEQMADDIDRALRAAIAAAEGEPAG